MNTPPRRLIAMVPPGTSPDVREALVIAALSLAGSQRAALAAKADLDIVEWAEPGAAPPEWFRGSGEGGSTVTHWHVHAEGPWPAGRLDGERLLALLVATADAIEPAHDRPVLWLLPAGAGEEAAARFAWRRAGAAGRCLGRVSRLALAGREVHAERAGWGGRATISLATDAACCVAAWRPEGGRRAPSATGEAAVRVVEKTLAVRPAWPAPREATPEPSADGGCPLEGAALVVSGGRGVEDEAGFEHLRRIAAHLGASHGGSLPAVDAGLVPVARQIGQSGRFVSPRVYLAVGISGTPQHLAGLAAEARIVAVNIDATAPIFAVSELGVVADAKTFLPLLERAVSVQRPRDDGTVRD